MESISIDKFNDAFNAEEVVKQLYSNGFLSVEFKYKSNYNNTKRLRELVEAICNVFGMTDTQKSRMVLISDELNNNAIEYGSNADGINKLRITAEKQGNNINFNLEVEDNGKGKKPKKALDMETMRAHQLKLGYFNHESIRGRGLFLITVQIVDRLYFKNSADGGLIVGIKTKI